MEELLGAVLRLVLLRKPDEVTKTAPSDLRINQRRILQDLRGPDHGLHTLR